MLKPYCVDLYAAIGKTIKTFGMAERVHFQLGGYELETNFVVDDAVGVEDSLLGRNFLRAYPGAGRFDRHKNRGARARCGITHTFRLVVLIEPFRWF